MIPDPPIIESSDELLVWLSTDGMRRYFDEVAEAVPARMTGRVVEKNPLAIPAMSLRYAVRRAVEPLRAFAYGSEASALVSAVKAGNEAHAARKAAPNSSAAKRALAQAAARLKVAQATALAGYNGAAMATSLALDEIRATLPAPTRAITVERVPVTLR